MSQLPINMSKYMYTIDVLNVLLICYLKFFQITSLCQNLERKIPYYIMSKIKHYAIHLCFFVNKMQ